MDADHALHRASGDPAIYLAKTKRLPRRRSSLSEDWTEVNLVIPATLAATAGRRLPTEPILQLIDPLVHASLSGRWEEWHYFWEYEPIKQLHIRLRFLWPASVSDTDRLTLTSELDHAQAAGMIARWFKGDNGIEGGTYTGEAADYVPELWERIRKDWTSGCELAVAILKLEAQGALPPDKSLEFHWRRREHLFADPLGLTHGPEADLCLDQARRYVRGNGNDSRVNDILTAINQYNPQLP